MKTVTTLFILFLTLHCIAQNIVNTLPAAGIFSIKDATTTFFSVDQSNGHIILPAEAVTTQNGFIFKGTTSFLHTFRPAGCNGGNIFLGLNAGNLSMNGTVFFQSSGNTAIGTNSLNAITTGYFNCAFGISSLEHLTTGTYNCAFGSNALGFNSTGSNNSAFGPGSMASATGSDNCAFGSGALSNNTANMNCAFGIGSLRESTGESNCAFGYLSCYSNTSGYNNTAVGCSTLYNCRGGNRNTSIGFEALRNVSSGWYNTALGNSAGSNITTGYNNTCIGNGAEASSATAVNEIVLGNNLIAYLRCQVNSISALSDARDKTNIKDLHLGLDFLMNIKPRLYNWDKREWYTDKKPDGTKMQQTPTAGFIAQELDEAQMKANAEWLNLVLKSNPEKLEATPGNLLPIMVKAIQDLKLENEKLERKLENMEKYISEIKKNSSEKERVNLTAK